MHELAIDETSKARGHDYISLAADASDRCVVAVAEGHGADSIAQLTAELQGRGCDTEQVTSVSIDMSPAFIKGCAEHLSDVTLDAASFADLALPVERVFITENETNFLAFPQVPQAIVVFGAGYGWEALARAAWLHRCRLHYWGDIDTHGFAILDQLRGYFPHAGSLLMDRETLRVHRAHWGEEPEPARHDLSRLTTDEQAVYDDLRFDRIQPRLRLEQERVGFGWLSAQLHCRLQQD
ncbi:MAG: transposase [Gammaproteobacteria bacterium]|nr:transposase [Gammaproteobacteria bacterium]